MGVNFGFGKKRKMRKLMVAYLENRMKEKKSFEEQLQRLGVQLRKDAIDQITFERMRAALEINFIRQREEAREQLSLFPR